MNPPAQSKMRSVSSLRVGKKDSEQRSRTFLVAKKQDSSGDDSGCQGALTASESTSPIRATRMRREGEEKEKKNKRAPSPSVLLTSNRLPRNQKYLPHPSPTGMKPRMPGAARACSGRHFFGWPPPWLQGFGHMDLGLLSRLAHASIFLEPLLKS